MEQTLRSQLETLKEADLIIGIPSYNCAKTIGPVVRTVTAGLHRYFPAAKAVFINSDGGSTDGTREEAEKAMAEPFKILFASHAVHSIHQILHPYHGIPGRENAFRTIFEATKGLNAKACAVVDPGLRSITPEWIESLLTPVYKEGFDYVAPVYARHKFDGTITNGIVYPLTRALYGKKVRQLIGGNMGLSGRLAQFYLTKDVWETDVGRFEIDLWTITLAITEGYKICQAFVGPKVYDSKGPERDLASIFTQVVSSVYSLMEEFRPFWKTTGEAEPVPIFGSPYEIGPDPVLVDVESMIKHFRLGIQNLMELWRPLLAPETASSLESLSRLAPEAFSFSQELWSRLVYDFAIAYHKRPVPRDHLLKSMIPLYLGQVASFVKEHQEGSAEGVEEAIESRCRVFEEMKPYLIEHWDGATGGGEKDG